MFDYTAIDNSTELNEHQKNYVKTLRRLLEEVPDGIDVAMIVENGVGFFVMGSCCRNCAYATIHMAADHVPDPRKGTTGLEDIVIVVQ